jgi:hypothetical protein
MQRLSSGISFVQVTDRAQQSTTFHSPVLSGASGHNLSHLTPTIFNYAYNFVTSTTTLNFHDHASLPQPYPTSTTISNLYNHTQPP